MPFEFKAVGSEGIGKDDLRTGINVGFMNSCDYGWIGEVELIETFFKADTAIMQQRAHSSIGNQGFFASQKLKNLVISH
jgi:hypothetical protein